MDAPRISVIITTYNYAHTVAAAIDSVLAQDWDNLEVLVMDNASVDATASVLERYRDDARIRYVRQARNIGMMANHNAGLKLATGDYIVFLSADDILLPGHFVTHYRYQQAHPDIDVSFTPLYLMNEYGIVVERRKGELLASFHGRNNPFASLLAFGCDMCMPTMLVPRRLYDNYGGFDEEFIGADFELFVRWAAAGVRFAYISEALAAYRTHPGQRTSTGNYLRTGEGAHDYLAILEKHLSDENAPLLRGYERTVGRILEHKYASAQNHGFHVDAATKQRIDALHTRLREIRTAHEQQKFVPQLQVFVIADESLPALNRSLRSLLAQTYEDWEAVVIAPDQRGLEGFCRYLDPRGRIRAMSLHASVSLGSMLNTATCINDGNCFAFMHAGTSFAPDHLEKIVQAFAQAQADVVLAPSFLSVLTDSATAQAFDHLLPSVGQAQGILAAPFFPLDAVAFRRSAVDTVFYFNEGLSDFCEWDILLRLVRAFTLHGIDSPVELQESLQRAPRLRITPATLHAIETIDKLYPAPSAEIAQLRRSYLGRMREMLDVQTPQIQTLEQIARLYFVYRGGEVVQNAAAAAA